MDMDTRYAFDRSEIVLIQAALKVYLEQIEKAESVPIDVVWNESPFDRTKSRVERLQRQLAKELMSMDERLEAYRKERDEANS